MKNLITKQIMVIAIALCTLSVAACKKDKTETSGKTGTFTIDGTSYTGNSETQTFVNDNYSIVCQQDDPFKLIQVTFHNKAEAEAGGTFDVADFSLNVPTGEAEIGVDGLTFDPDGNHTISVSGKKITISNVSLDQTGGGSKHPTINSASINF
ncbi:MAG: hypothetical protein KDD21_04715 [Bacteroidetes bacterium]|nr:hypothetical protein [Bacteroidota bacterium]